MSVEDARADLVQRIIADRPWVPALDRLILEVRAEMPCYWRWNEEDEIEPDCPTYSVEDARAAVLNRGSFYADAWKRAPLGTDAHEAWERFRDEVDRLIAAVREEERLLPKRPKTR